MNADTISNVIQGGIALISFAALFVAFYVRSEAKDATSKGCGELEDKIGILIAAMKLDDQMIDKRVVRLESVIEDLPRGRDIGRIDKRLEQIAGSMEAMREKINGIESSSKANSLALQRVENHVFKLEKD